MCLRRITLTETARQRRARRGRRRCNRAAIPCDRDALTAHEPLPPHEPEPLQPMAEKRDVRLVGLVDQSARLLGTLIGAK